MIVIDNINLFFYTHEQTRTFIISEYVLRLQRLREFDQEAAHAANT